MLRKIKIGPKLIGSYALAIFLSVAIGIIGISSMNKMATADKELYGSATVPMGSFVTISSLFHQSRIVLRDILRHNDPAYIEGKVKELEYIVTTVSACAKVIDTTLVTEKGREVFNELVAARKVYKESMDQIVALAKVHKVAEAYALIDGTAALAARNEQNAIDELVKLKTAVAEDLFRKNVTLSKQNRIMMVTFIFLGVIVVTIMGLLLIRSITRPLSRVVEMIQELGKGHLGMRLNYNSQDELGILASTMDKYADDLQTVVVGTMKKIAVGDMSMEITAKDSQDEITPALRDTVNVVKKIIDSTKHFVVEATNGNLSARGNPDEFVGGYREIIVGLNQTLEAIQTPINEAAEVLEKIAGRDLAARVSGNYKGEFVKVKNSVNVTADNLDTALQQVAQATEQVASASQQISAGSQSLAQGANQQASNLEEVSSSLEEMSAMTKQNAENANQAKNLSDGATKNAEQGKMAMNKMSDAINRIKESSDQTAKIVKTIDEIAMQTNLLALNAAVEAARAGEAGRGFAVVAEEVRNLAQRSAEAAKNTADMIAESVKNSEDGVTIALDVSKSFEAIAEGNNKVNVLIAEIAAASQEQSQGIDQVNVAVTQMDTVTQQNAANSEESASAAEELSSQAEELQNMIAQFHLSNEGRESSGMTMQFRQNRKKTGKCVTGSGSKTQGGATEKKVSVQPAAGQKTHGAEETPIELDIMQLKEF